MSVQTETFFAAPAITSTFIAMRERFVAAAAKRKIYRTTLTELESLSSRDLADLGISRSSIKEIAREAAYGA